MAAVHADDLGGDGEPDRSRLSLRAGESFEQVIARFLGTPGPLSRTSTKTRRSSRQALTRSFPTDGGHAFDGLDGVGHEVADNAEQMIAISIDAQRVVHVEAPREAPLARQAERLAHLLDQGFRRKSSRRGGASSARPKRSVSLQKFIARSSGDQLSAKR